MSSRAIVARASGVIGSVVIGLVAACGGSTIGGALNDTTAPGSEGGADGHRGGDAGRIDDLDSGSAADVKKTSRAPSDHRASATACSHDRGPGDAVMGGGFGACTKDVDCTAGENGRCLYTRNGARVTYCSYDGCFADAECSGMACTCREAPNDANRCTTDGNCHVDADCGPGGYCSPSPDFDKINTGTSAYWCHVSADTCVDDADCSKGTGGPLTKCAFDPKTMHWACSDHGFYPPGAGGSGGGSSSGGK